MMTTKIAARTLLATVCLISSAFFEPQQSRDAAMVLRTGTAEISGALVTDETTPVPARRATVTLTSEALGGAGMIAVTDEAGRFAFSSLPAGRYSLVASKGGYLPATYGARRPGGAGIPIVLAEGQRMTGLAMKILKGSVLSGTVIDENGQPAPNATVRVLRYVWFATGDRRLVQLPAASSGITDDRGMYRIYGLEPGEYFVSATSPMRLSDSPPGITAIRQITDADIRRAQVLLRASGSMPATAPVQNPAARPASSTVNWAPVYYPGVIVAADAAPIVLGPHEERTGVDVQLRMVPTANVEGLITGPDGTPQPNVPIILLDPGPQFEGILAMALRNATSDKNGKFLFPAINPGRYTIMAFSSGDLRLTGASEVLVDGRDVATSIALTLGVPVSGRMVFEGASAPPDPTTFAPTLLFPLLGGYGLKVEDDGAFTFLRVAPGKYRIRINGGAPVGWMLKSVTLNGTDVYDIPFEVKPSESVAGLTITFTDRRTEISGTMQDAAGKPAPDYVLIVFSADKRFWLPQSRRTQQVRPGSNGQFIVRDLPAGDYFISALTDVEPGQWNDPAFLAELAAHTPIRITLADGEKKVQDIRVGGG